MYKWVKVIIILATAGVFLGACSNNSEQAEVMQVVEVEPPMVVDDPTTKSSQTSGSGIEATQIVETVSDEPSTVSTSEPISTPDQTVSPLTERSGPRTQTSGTVPHVQIGVESVTIGSLPGARGMWLSDDIALAHPEAIVSGREFAHIHPDGSLHAPLPFERALEVAEKGWGERHPWADEREGWDGLVMLFTPQSMAELE